jgi:hypothetical protein
MIGMSDPQSAIAFLSTSDFNSLMIMPMVGI